MVINVKKILNNNSVVKKLNNFYESMLYPALISLIILLSYVLKCEVIGVFISIFILSVGLIVCKDLKPLIPLLLGFIMIIPTNRGFSEGANTYVDYILGYLPYIIVLSCILVFSFTAHFVLWGGFVKIF
ncbi:MAG: hypothetical protein IJW26_06535, partial [Clostridia bacterium]|nr:hypothetical protein [Clostridia bacterium]